MPHKYKPYSQYKDSGVEWLGDAPVEWGIFRLGQYFEERREKVSDKDYAPLSVTKNGIVPQLDNAAKTDAGDNRKLVRKGDFVINSRSDRKGSSGISPLEGSVSLISIVIRPRELSAQFVHHLLRSCAFQEEFYRFGKGIVADLWSTNYSSMKNILIPIPHEDEQRTIAAFLNHETGEIDELIEKQQKLIELLAEKRQAVISHAVTKGLDPNASMKDSGIEWLGDIPEHWKTLSIRRIIEMIEQGYSPSSSEALIQRNNARVLKISAIKQGSFNEDEVKPIDDKFYKSQYQVHKGDLLVTRGNTPELVADACIVNSEQYSRIMMSDLVYRLTTDRSIDRHFLCYWLLSSLGRLQIKRDARGSSMTMAKVSQAHIKSWIISLPPLEEQKLIIKYIASQIAKIDKLISKAKSAIELMRERRTALISAAVTGKIDVRKAEMSTAQKGHKANIHFKRSVLAAEIAERMHHQSKFGRVKFQKVLALCDLHLGMDIGGNYLRDAAGPFDNKMMRSITSQLKKQKWFQSVKREDGYGTKYEPMEKTGGHQEYFYKYWGDKLSEFNQLLALLEPMKTEQAEIVATLYSAWHDFLKQGKQPTDEELVIEVRTNWHESKKRIEPSRWHKAIDWMRKKSLFPKQRGA